MVKTNIPITSLTTCSSTPYNSLNGSFSALLVLTSINTMPESVYILPLIHEDLIHLPSLILLFMIDNYQFYFKFPY